MAIYETLERNRWRRVVRSLDRHLSAVDPIFAAAILGILYACIQTFLVLNSTPSTSIPNAWRQGMLWGVIIVTVFLVVVGCIRQFSKKEVRPEVTVERVSCGTLQLHGSDVVDLVYSSGIPENEREELRAELSKPGKFWNCGQFLILHVRNTGGRKLSELSTEIVDLATNKRIGRCWVQLENQVITTRSLTCDLPRADSANLMLARSVYEEGWSTIEAHQDNKVPSLMEISLLDRNFNRIKLIERLRVRVEFKAADFAAGEEYEILFPPSGKPEVRYSRVIST